MSDPRFTETHEWVRVVDGQVVVGITKFAAEQLGDVVYVELPEVGRAVNFADEIAVVESVKAASEIYAPVSGVVVASNAALADNPAAVNADPEGEGWFFKLTPEDVGAVDKLMTREQYDALVKGS